MQLRARSESGRFRRVLARRVVARRVHGAPGIRFAGAVHVGSAELFRWSKYSPERKRRGLEWVRQLCRPVELLIERSVALVDVVPNLSSFRSWPGRAPE